MLIREYPCIRIKIKSLFADLLKMVSNPDMKLPTYVAVDIARLPPVDVEHLDVSALLRKMMLLRSEVRSVGILKAEIE